MTSEQFASLTSQIRIECGCIMVILFCFFLLAAWHVRRHWDD